MNSILKNSKNNIIISGGATSLYIYNKKLKIERFIGIICL